MDAEQSYFQPAIDDLVMGFISKHNEALTPSSPSSTQSQTLQSGPTIYNTYQLYLKDGLSRLKRDVEWAHQQGVSFGCKIVRGMVISFTLSCHIKSPNFHIIKNDLKQART